MTLASFAIWLAVIFVVCWLWRALKENPLEFLTMVVIAAFLAYWFKL